MNYEYIEKLVNEAKAGSLQAKENLTIEFTPLINSISKKTYIHGYDISDIRNECFKTLFICIDKYKLDTHRFVAYATNSIKNNINCLITKIINRSNMDGLNTLSLCDNLEYYISSYAPSPEEELCNSSINDELAFALNNKLSEEEKDLISFLFFKHNTLTNYSYYKNISYVTAHKRKKKVLEKLKKYIDGGNDLCQLTT